MPGLDQELVEMLAQEVTVESFVSNNEYSTPTYGPANTLSARVQSRSKKVIMADGRELVSSAMVYLAGGSGVLVNDRITLPDGNSPVILSIERLPDEFGLFYEVVYV